MNELSTVFLVSFWRCFDTGKNDLGCSNALDED